jgi:hypothetical protein
VENLPACAPPRVQGNFCRSSGGAEIDPILARPDGRPWAIEIKDRVPGRGVRSDRKVIDSGEGWEPFSLRPRAS